MTAAGFEPAKHDAQDLKSRPVDQTRERCLIAFYIKKDFLSMTGFEPATPRLEVWCAIQLRYTDKL